MTGPTDGPADGPTDGPARARLTSYEHDGLTFDVADEGPIDGDVVVLLHGFPERASCWRLVAPLLHAQGYRTIAPDQRGYSPGARPTRRRDYTLGRLVGDVAALIGLTGGPVHLVGHDWGAAVGWATVAEHPDLVRTWTAVSVPHPRAFLRSWVSSTQGLKSSYMLLFNVPRLPELLQRRAPRRFEASLRRAGMTSDDVARFRSEIAADGALPGGLAWYRAMFLRGDALERPRITRPTTMVWSDGDVALGRKGIDLTPDWVDAPYELVVLEGVSHWIPTQAPGALAEAILERVTSA
ncbi:alpha/beta fold hydrolase [Nocardioides plantarum]|uniref:Alpha/beta fold hydrolase n=1 Tax=Nocardioides plantarum TaxID=29299 RepID=A0ABV5K980_9ACTN|nr:alpha/beta fold hydrolase [Nocardioides plantarum]